MAARPLPADHEAHGYCANCRNMAHRYPFGWQHVNGGAYSCPDLDPRATCCEPHRRAWERQAVIVRAKRLNEAARVARIADREGET